MASAQAGKHVILRDKMEKRRIMKKSTTFIAKFETRVFELYQHLIIYSKPSSKSKSKTKSRGEICVMAIKVCECVLDSAFNREFVFQVGYIDKATMYYLYIQADSEDMRSRWISNIRKLCAAYNNQRMFSQYHPGHFKRSSKSWICCQDGSEENIGCKATFKYETIDTAPTMLSRHKTPNLTHVSRVSTTTDNTLSDSENSDAISPAGQPLLRDQLIGDIDTWWGSHQVSMSPSQPTHRP
eukprot:sb/3469096/